MIGALSLLFLASWAWAQEDQPSGAGRGGLSDFSDKAVGTAGSDFLLMDLGARGIAMGGAFSAVTNDASSVYWNPAGLARVSRFSATFMYSRHVEDISSHAASLAQRVSDTSVLAAGLRYRDIGSIDHTDDAGNTLGTFHPRDYVAELSWGQSVFDLSDSEVEVNLGATARWLHSDYLLQADAFATDFGLQSRFYGWRFPYTLAFVAQNMGKGQKFDQVRDSLPFRARLGAALSPSPSLTLALDAILPINNRPHGALGVEYSLPLERRMKGAVRGGFNSLTVTSLGLATGFSAGLGLAVGDLSFDYAFVPFGVLGSALHRFSISFNLPAKLSQRYKLR